MEVALSAIQELCCAMGDIVVDYIAGVAVHEVCTLAFCTILKMRKEGRTRAVVRTTLHLRATGAAISAT